MSAKLNEMALKILDGFDWRKLPRYSDEVGPPTISEYDRQFDQRQTQWLKSKKLQ
jgi:hypothetical protein